jgi:hypothetical protein
MGSGGTAPRILSLGTRWGEWSASRQARFTHGERTLSTAGLAPERGLTWWQGPLPGIKPWLSSTTIRDGGMFRLMSTMVNVKNIQIIQLKAV